MERKVVAVCTVVGFLGLLSAALGFAAEGTRLKATDVQATKSGECIYPKSPALALGLLATVALITAQAIINTAAGCICSKRNSMPSDSNWTVALISFIFSWEITWHVVCLSIHQPCWWRGNILTCLLVNPESKHEIVL